MKKNTELKEFYDSVYKKGEQTHYSNFTVSDVPYEVENEIIKSMNWKNKQVIDVGCGTGFLASMIAKKGAKVLGIDYSKSAIDIAKKKYVHKNLEFQNIDFKQNIKKKFDVIISIGTLEHFDKPINTLKQFKKSLNPGGKIIITVPNWSNPRGYVLMTLYYLFKAPITLADIHYLTPKNFESWAKKLDMKLKWKTLNHSWGHGNVMIRDLKRRLPKVISDTKLSVSRSDINNLIKWLEMSVIPFNHSSIHSGAMGLYIFSLPKRDQKNKNNKV